jgi:hypothetical protein
MRNPFPRFMALAPLALAVASCSATEHPSLFAQAQSILVGETTRGELLTRFGEPARTSDENGERITVWREEQASLVGVPWARELRVVLNRSGRVESYEVRSTFSDDRP